MDLHLLDKVIVITGAASGIGKSIARSLASEKAVVCIIDRNGVALADFAKELEETKATVFPLQVELTNQNECALAIEKILNKFGQIYGLINNAGLNDGVSIEHGDLKSFNESLEKMSPITIQWLSYVSRL